VGTLEATEGKPRDPAEMGRRFLAECGGTADGVLKNSPKRCAQPQVDGRSSICRSIQSRASSIARRPRQAGNPVFKGFSRPQTMSAVAGPILMREHALRRHWGPARRPRLPEGHFTDAVSAVPRGVHAFPGGFELRSKWKMDDTPVTLVSASAGSERDRRRVAGPVAHVKGPSGGLSWRNGTVERFRDEVMPRAGPTSRLSGLRLGPTLFA